MSAPPAAAASTFNGVPLSQLADHPGKQIQWHGAQQVAFNNFLFAHGTTIETLGLHGEDELYQLCRDTRGLDGVTRDPAALPPRLWLAIRKRMLSSLSYRLRKLVSEKRVTQYYHEASKKTVMYWPQDVVAEFTSIDQGAPSQPGVQAEQPQAQQRPAAAAAAIPSAPALPLAPAFVPMNAPGSTPMPGPPIPHHVPVLQSAPPEGSDWTLRAHTPYGVSVVKMDWEPTHPLSYQTTAAGGGSSQYQSPQEHALPSQVHEQRETLAQPTPPTSSPQPAARERPRSPTPPPPPPPPVYRRPLSPQAHHARRDRSRHVNVHPEGVRQQRRSSPAMSGPSSQSRRLPREKSRHQSPSPAPPERRTSPSCRHSRRERGHENAPWRSRSYSHRKHSNERPQSRPYSRRGRDRRQSRSRSRSRSRAGSSSHNRYDRHGHRPAARSRSRRGNDHRQSRSRSRSKPSSGRENIQARSHSRSRPYPRGERLHPRPQSQRGRSCRQSHSSLGSPSHSPAGSHSRFPSRSPSRPPSYSPSPSHSRRSRDRRQPPSRSPSRSHRGRERHSRSQSQPRAQRLDALSTSLRNSPRDTVRRQPLTNQRTRRDTARQEIITRSKLSSRPELALESTRQPQRTAQEGRIARDLQEELEELHIEETRTAESEAKTARLTRSQEANIRQEKFKEFLQCRRIQQSHILSQKTDARTGRETEVMTKPTAVRRDNAGGHNLNPHRTQHNHGKTTQPANPAQDQEKHVFSKIAGYDTTGLVHHGQFQPIHSPQPRQPRHQGRAAFSSPRQPNVVVNRVHPPEDQVEPGAILKLLRNDLETDRRSDSGSAKRAFTSELDLVRRLADISPAIQTQQHSPDPLRGPFTMQPRRSRQSTHPTAEFRGPNQYPTNDHSSTPQSNNLFGSVLPGYPDYDDAFHTQKYSPKPLKLNRTMSSSVVQQQQRQTTCQSPAHGTTSALNTASLLKPAPGLPQLNHLTEGLLDHANSTSPSPRSSIKGLSRTSSPLRPSSAHAHTSEWASQRPHSLSSPRNIDATLGHLAAASSLKSVGTGGPKFMQPARRDHPSQPHGAEDLMNDRCHAQRDLALLMDLIDRVADWRIQRQLGENDAAAEQLETHSMFQEMEDVLEANQSVRKGWILMLMKGAMGNLSTLYADMGSLS